MNQIPLWRNASRLLLRVEQAARHFPRYHKYTLGSEFRQQAMRVWRLIVRAYNDRVVQWAHPVRRLHAEVGYLRGGIKWRVLRELYRPVRAEPARASSDLPPLNQSRSSSHVPPLP